MSTRQKSESGAYMSQYDTEVEKRLQSLEAEIKKLKAEVASNSQKAVAPAPAASAGVDKRLDVIETVLRGSIIPFDKLSKKLQ